jgi:hypothetical protein
MDRDEYRSRIPRERNVDLSGGTLDRGPGIVLVVCGDRFDRIFGLLDGRNRLLVESRLTLLLILLSLRLNLRADLLFGPLMLLFEIGSRERRGLGCLGRTTYAFRIIRTTAGRDKQV